MQAGSRQVGVCYAYQKNECTRGNKCKFQHSIQKPLDEESKKRKREDNDLANVINNHQGVVLLGDRAPVEVAPLREPAVKLKKPKHLKRKLEKAAAMTDVTARAEEILLVEKEKDNLAEFKKNASKMWKKTCQKLVKKSKGDDSWDEELFQRLVNAKLGKEAFLKALGIPDDMLKN